MSKQDYENGFIRGASSIRNEGSFYAKAQALASELMDNKQYEYHHNMKEHVQRMMSLALDFEQRGVAVRLYNILRLFRDAYEERNKVWYEYYSDFIGSGGRADGVIPFFAEIYDKFGEDGFGKDGYGFTGYDREGFNREGFDRGRRDRDGDDKYGYDIDGMNSNGYDVDGFDEDGYRGGFDRRGYDRDGFHQSEYE